MLFDNFNFKWRYATQSFPPAFFRIRGEIVIFLKLTEQMLVQKYGELKRKCKKRTGELFGNYPYRTQWCLQSREVELRLTFLSEFRSVGTFCSCLLFF